VDPAIATSEQGIRAVKWSFLLLFVTALLQLPIVFLSGSVALLADTIHNFGDAATAIPLGVAFSVGRRKPTKRFSYGFGRLEDLAGVAVVGVILTSAVVAAYEAVERLLHPRHHDSDDRNRRSRFMITRRGNATRDGILAFPRLESSTSLTTLLSFPCAANQRSDRSSGSAWKFCVNHRLIFALGNPPK
jgi:hypothetical protein